MVIEAGGGFVAEPELEGQGYCQRVRHLAGVERTQGDGAGRHELAGAAKQVGQGAGKLEAHVGRGVGHEVLGGCPTQ